MIITVSGEGIQISILDKITFLVKVVKGDFASPNPPIFRLKLMISKGKFQKQNCRKGGVTQPDSIRQEQ